MTMPAMGSSDAPATTSATTATRSTGQDRHDRQRQRTQRGNARPGNRLPSPPRQRRPAMAALAVLLIVGCALVAGVLAVRMDSRVPVLAAAHDISPGSKITAADLKTVEVSAGGTNLVGEKYAAEVIGTYAQTRLHAGELIDGHMVTHDKPISAGKAVVNVKLNPALSPAGYLKSGDLVEVIFANAQAGKGKVLCTGYVLEIHSGKSGGLSGDSAGQATVLVPQDAAKRVVDAASGDKVGLAVIARSQSPDTPLQAG